MRTKDAQHANLQSGRLSLAVAALGVCVALWQLAYYFPRTVDDMFIFLRYAENLVAGHGPVYNLGEPVEGFSSPLWTALLALGVAIGVHGVIWAKLLGFGAYAALALGIDAFARERLKLGRLTRAGAFALLACNAYIASWTMYGLETPAYLALLAWTAVSLGRRMDAPTPRNGVALALCASALCLSRPEAPLYLLALGFALALEPLRLGAVRARVIRSVAPALGVIVLYGGYVALRVHTFGLLFPHTYYAKRGSGFSTESWALLWGRGASAPEVALLACALLASLWLAARPTGTDDAPRSLVPAAVFGMALFFVAKVIPDWMPNVRHLLPLWVFAPLALLGLIERMAASPRGAERAVALALAIAVALTGVALLRVDSRYSQKDFRTHGRGEHWVLHKTPERWQDAQRALRGEEPEHAARFPDFQHGMITQLYRLFEADARPLEASWYLSRDIGRVGWFSPVNVFETDGLFTPAIVASEAWREDGSVDAALLEEGFDRPVVMTELIDGWDTALWSNGEVRARYEGFRPGNRRHLALRERERPTPEQVLERYERALARVPGFYLLTLYGECVGCALEQRVETVRSAVAALDAPSAPAGDPLVRFDDGLVLEGCAVEPEEVVAGASATLRCTIAVTQTPSHDWQVFTHIDGHGERVLADHAPFGGLLRVSDLASGQRVSDQVTFTVPEDAAHGERAVYAGFWSGSRRLGAQGGTVEPDGRARVATIRVVGPR